MIQKDPAALIPCTGYFADHTLFLPIYVKPSASYFVVLPRFAFGAPD